MSHQSSSWEDVSASNSNFTFRDSDNHGHLCDPEHRLTRDAVNIMGPNIRKPVMDDESSTDTSSEPRFHPPGQGGVPLYSPSDTPAKLEKRSIASFTANPSSNPILSTGLQHNLSSQPNMRAIEGHNPPSQDSNLKHNPEPVTPVRSDPYSDQRVYNMAAPVAASSIGQSYGQHNNDCTQSSGAPMMLPALYIGPAPLVPMGDDKDSHPAVLSIRNQCGMGQQRIAGLRSALMHRADVGPEVRQLLDVDMEQFSKLLRIVVQQVDLLSNTLDENAEQHQTLKKMLASQTLESERLNATINQLTETLKAVGISKPTLQPQNFQEFMKHQGQGKRSPFGGPNFAADKQYFDHPAAAPIVDDGHGTKSMRSVFGFGIPNHSVGSSPDFPRPATAMLGYPAAAQRAVSYAAPPRYNHNSGRKFSGQKSSGAARFNYFDEDTPTRPGSGFRDSSMTQVLAPRPVGDEDRLSAEWRDRFGKLWTAVAGYCRTYVAGENKNLHLFLQANAPNVWQYICDVLYPNNPTTAGSSHAQILLADLESRAYLVQRLVIQYFINQMWCAEGWNQFNEDTDRGLKLAEDNLKTLESYRFSERQAALEMRAQLIARILMDPRFQEFRQFKINHHVDRVKMIVGPMISTTKMRNDSQFDLHSLVSHAMELSAIMFESRRRFDFIWNDTCAKFSVEFHSSVDNTMPPLTLQMRQWRLKLVITPGINMRDERSPGTKSHILKSDVLVMN